MQFSFEIDLDEYELGSSEQLKEAIIQRAIRSITDSIWDWDARRFSEEEIRGFARKCCKEHEEDIINGAISRIVQSVEKKQQIKELTPSTKDIQSINRENEKYFIDLIDKAIAKRFK